MSIFLRNLTIISLAVLILWALKNVFNLEPTKQESPFEIYAEELMHQHEHVSDKKDEVKEQKKEEGHPVENNEEKDRVPESIDTTDADLEDYFKQLRIDYLKKYKPVIGHGMHRTDIVIRYYYHEPDNAKVQKLNDLKLYQHIRPVSETLRDHESNSIYYGDSVSTSDIQLIAYMLIKSGLPIKQIIPSKYHDSWKSRALEIGSDPEFANSPNMKLDQIKEFRNTLLD